MKKTKKLHPLMFLPGTVMWGLFIAGAVTKNTVLIGVGVGVFALTAAVLITRKVKSSSSVRAERKRIWESGQEAKARVVSIGTRGGGINDHPMVDFELDVSVAGRAPYRASVSAIISKLAIPRIQPECELSVRVDPGDISKLVVDAALTPYGYR